MHLQNISPADVQSVLSKHILADGFDLTFDMEKSKGVYIYDSKYNRTLLDFFTCFASVPLGYNHPKMLGDEAFKKDLLLAALTNPSNSDIYTEQFAHFVDVFGKVGIPEYLPHAFFISGGGLAVENALKTAMDWKVQKNFSRGYKQEKGFKVIHFEHAFHGRTGYTLTLTNTKPVKTRGFAKFDWPRVSTPVISFDTLESNPEELYEREEKSIAEIKRAFADNKDDICAIIIEPIQSEGGDNHVRKEFLEQLRILADENEAMLIYDEVQTGVGLTGKFWCHEHFGEKARPDILAFGKKMQVCGILVSSRVDENPKNVFTESSRINSTWGGNLADMVRSAKVLEIIADDNLCANAAETGAYLQQQLKEVANNSDLLSNVRGLGLLTSFDFPDGPTRDKFIAMGMQKNVMFLACGDNSIRFRPALVMDKAHIDEGIFALKDILPNLLV